MLIPCLAHAALTVLLVAGLYACAETPVTRTDVSDEVSERAARIVIGQSTRADVQASLGKPWIGSEEWRFDVFRVTGWNLDALIVPAPLPVPVPMADRVSGVVLVSYGSDGRVVGREFAVGYSHTIAEIGAGDVRLSAGKGAQDFVSVSAARRNQFLGRPIRSNRCQLLVGCEDYWCGLRVTLDGRNTIEMPYEESTYHQGLLLLEASPGAHRVDIRSAGRSHAFDARSDFTCASGERLYALVGLALSKVGVLRAHWKATVTVSGEIPRAFKDRRLLIWGQERWLVAE